MRTHVQPRACDAKQHRYIFLYHFIKYFFYEGKPGVQVWLTGSMWCGGDGKLHRHIQSTSCIARWVCRSHRSCAQGALSQGRSTPLSRGVSLVALGAVHAGSLAMTHATGDQSMTKMMTIPDSLARFHEVVACRSQLLQRASLKRRLTPPAGWGDCEPPPAMAAASARVSERRTSAWAQASVACALRAVPPPHLGLPMQSISGSPCWGGHAWSRHESLHPALHYFEPIHYPLSVYTGSLIERGSQFLKRVLTGSQKERAGRAGKKADPNMVCSGLLTLWDCGVACHNESSTCTMARAVGASTARRRAHGHPHVCTRM